MDYPPDEPDELDEEYSAVLAPILRDLAAGHVAAPRFGGYAAGDEDWIGPGMLMIMAPDGSGCGISLLPDTPFTEQLARVADQVQEWAVEVLWAQGASAVWPQCPDHPDSHPLRAQAPQWMEGARPEDAAVWVCPKSGRIVCAIGEVSEVCDAQAGGSRLAARRAQRKARRQGITATRAAPPPADR